jgi:hypothetical protein
MGLVGVAVQAASAPWALLWVTGSTLLFGLLGVALGKKLFAALLP